jgi:hypothetical protein
MTGVAIPAVPASGSALQTGMLDNAARCYPIAAKRNSFAGAAKNGYNREKGLCVITGFEVVRQLTGGLPLKNTPFTCVAVGGLLAVLAFISPGLGETQSPKAALKISPSQLFTGDGQRLEQVVLGQRIENGAARADAVLIFKLGLVKDDAGARGCGANL